MDDKIKELLTRLSFFAEDGMGEPKLVEFAKQADALLLEMARKPNTQQPVAWIDDDGMVFWKDGIPPARPMVQICSPLPRDVLIAAAKAAYEKGRIYGYYYDTSSEYDKAPSIIDECAAIADRYASKVQPEPVKQQLLAALKAAKIGLRDWEIPENRYMAQEAIESAIAAAEAAQPVGVEQLKLAENNWPEKCPITRREFFMEIDGVPTYGGPFDSYTIPEMTGEASRPFHERELFVRRYDHDRGGWVEDEFIPLRVIHEDVLMGLEDAARQPASANPWVSLEESATIRSQYNACCNRDACRRLLDGAIPQQPASAQPVAVPDEITVSMAPHSQYAKGWNACRDAMLSAAQKPDGV